MKSAGMCTNEIGSRTAAGLRTNDTIAYSGTSSSGTTIVDD